MQRAARRRSSGLVAALAAVVVLAACGSSSTPSASVDSTAAAAVTTAASSAPASSSVPASSSSSSVAAASTVATTAPAVDVTLGGATQETAAPGASSSTAAPAVTVPIEAPTPDGYARAQDPEGLVSVAAPSSWTFLSLTDKMLQDLANNVADAVPEANRAQMAAAVASAGDYMKILGIGPARDGGGAPSVNVIVSPVSVPVSVLKELYPKQLAQAGSSVNSITEISVSGRQALEADVTVTMKQGTSHSNQVVIPITGKTIIISITGVDDATRATMVAAIVVPPGS